MQSLWTRREHLRHTSWAVAAMLLGNHSAARADASPPDSQALPKFRYEAIRNPVWRLPDIHLRDPAALVHEGKVHLWFTYYDPKKVTWHIGQSATEDFLEFEPIRLISPGGYASPGNVIGIGDEWILCYQQYAQFPHYLCIARSRDLIHWSEPERIFNTGPENKWNIDGRTIDPLLVPWQGRYYLFYTGSTRWGRQSGHNLIGLAVSDDLKNWTDLSPDRPVISADRLFEQPDGNENNWVLRREDRWFMLYSASLRHQKIACATSDDLIHWEKMGLCRVKVFPESERRFGAPVVLENLSGPGTFHMLFQGEAPTGHVSFFLLESRNLIDWE
ncbi:MAG: hypothetical protein Kow0040_03120 [Thermogutta sp.]